MEYVTFSGNIARWGKIATINKDEYPGIIFIDTEWKKIENYPEIPNGVYAIENRFPVQEAKNLLTGELFYVAPRGINRRHDMPFHTVCGIARKGASCNPHRGFDSYVINGIDGEFAIGPSGMLEDATERIALEKAEREAERQREEDKKLEEIFANFSIQTAIKTEAIRTINIYSLPGGCWFDDFNVVTFDPNATVEIPRYDDDPIEVHCTDADEDHQICQELRGKLDTLIEVNPDLYHNTLADGCYITLNGCTYKVHLIDQF